MMLLAVDLPFAIALFFTFFPFFLSSFLSFFLSVFLTFSTSSSFSIILYRYIIMLSIRKNPVIKLDIPKFSCDSDAVGPHLDEHPLTELLNVYGFLCLVG